MSPRWLKFLESLGSQGNTRIRMLESDEMEQALQNPDRWHRYDVLFYLFGPLAGSPWIPYHCPTIFAGIDKLAITPTRLEVTPVYSEERPEGAFRWATPDTMVLVDLAGPRSVEVGAILMEQSGVQFVCTFDHWPRFPGRTTAQPSIRAHDLVDALFTFAFVAAAGKRLTHPVAPVWLCDRRRLGPKLFKPTPGMFDNRYYIDDSILPGMKTLKKAGIRRVVYVAPSAEVEPLPDMVPFLIEAEKEGLVLERVAVDDGNSWIRPVPMKAPAPTRLPIREYRRSDLGGFGQLVPEPSEGGSYSSGGGGG